MTLVVNLNSHYLKKKQQLLQIVTTTLTRKNIKYYLTKFLVLMKGTLSSSKTFKELLTAQKLLHICLNNLN